MSDLYLTNVCTFALSPALYAQLRRCADDDRCSLSKVCIRAQIAALKDQRTLIAPHLPKHTLPPTRSTTLSFSYPKRLPELRGDFAALARQNQLQTSQFLRRAIYTFTKDYVSKDKEEAMQAAADGWL